MSIEKSFRITIESHGCKSIVEKPRSDLDIHEVEDMIKSVLLATGWGVTEVDITLGS